MTVETLIVGQLQTNCYLFFDEVLRQSFIIDPGDDADFIMTKVHDLKLKPVAILATHGHFDHILAAMELKLAFNIPFYLHKDDEFLLARMQQSALHFIGQKTDPPPQVDHYFNKMKILEIRNLKLEIITAPGHTPGSVCFYSQSEKILFAGDLIFAQGSRGRTDFAYGDDSKLQRSIKKILSLSPKITVYSGHGEKTTVANEKKYYNWLK